MPNQLYPILFMLSSTFSLSLTGLFSKYLSQHLDATFLSLLRFAVPAMFIFIFLFRHKIILPSRKEMLALWVRAVCIAICQVCFIYALMHLSLVESVVLFSTGPLFIPLLEKLMFSVNLSRMNLVGLVVTFIGVTLLAGDVSGIEIRAELLVGLAAGLFNAGSQLSLYRISQSRLNAFEINLWTFLFAVVVILPFVGVNVMQNTTLYDTSESSMFVLAMTMGVLALLIINTQVFRSKAYRLAESGSQLAPLIFTNLIFTAIWQLMFFDESYNPFQILGLALIIGANVCCVILPKWRKSRRMQLLRS